VSVAAGARGHWLAAWIHAFVRPEDGIGCSYSQSNDDGTNWDPSESYHGPLPYCGDPVVASDRRGHAYRVATSFELGFSTAFQRWLPVRSTIMLSRSANDGLSWGPWQTAVAPNPPGAELPMGLNDKPWLAVDGDLVILAWTVLERFGYGDLTVTVSQDGGLSFGPPTLLGKGIGVCLAIDGAGRVHLAAGNDLSRKIQYTSSANLGASWAPMVEVGDSGTGHINNTYPLVVSCGVAASGSVHLAWIGDVTGRGADDVWVVTSLDGGTTWGSQVRVNDDLRPATRGYAGIGTDSAGNVHVAWMDWRDGKPLAFRATSRDRGATFGANLRIDDVNASRAEGDYNSLAISVDDKIGYGWSDDRNPSTKVDIYFGLTGMQ